jgi:hypothetical protein
VGQASLRARVVRAAETALVERRVVSPIDVLTGVGWLHPTAVDRWRQGRALDLEREAQVGSDLLAAAVAVLGEWARARGLRPSETAYVASSRDRRRLRFTAGGDEAAELAYRTHWLSPDLSEKQRERIEERQSRPPDLLAAQPLGDWTCSLCGGTGSLLLMEDSGPVCLACADLDHLVFLPSGDATLSRRAKKASQLSAVVVRFSRARRRYERRGILVEETALERAEAECLADEDARARARARAAEHREREDVGFQARMASEIVRLFPGCPPERAEKIARHAGERGSGRVGRSAAGRALDERAVELAVTASVRHEDTPYDELLMSGVPRAEARDRIGDRVDRVLARWRSGIRLA